MDHKQQRSSAGMATQDRHQRREWSRPRLSRLKAGEAELGGNPVQPEGPLGHGS